MADGLQVNPVELNLTSNHILDAADDHAAATALHLDDLSDAVSRWRGKSKAAMHEVAARWEAQDAEHHERVTGLADYVSEAAQRYAAADGQDVPAGGSSQVAGPPPVSAPPSDVGLRL